MQETLFDINPENNKKIEDIKLTPMMKQYMDIKEKYSDCLLLFRMGDFYEVFFDDAKIASDILGLTITKRANTPMAGVPYHSIDNYLAKLIKSGKKIAICDQVEDPKQAKGIVKREVTQVITPGTISENKYLESKSNNYLASIIVSKTKVAISVCDISTGELSCTEIENENKAELINELCEEIIRFSPKEIMTLEAFSENEIIKQVKDKFPNIFYSTTANYTGEKSYAYKTLINHFKTKSLKSFGVEDNELLISILGSMIFYVKELSKTSLEHISNIKIYNRKDSMILDYATVSSLELLETIRNDNKKMTLFHTIDKTKTSMGGRYLKRILVEPLLQKEEIDKRLNNVEYFYNNTKLLYKIVDIISDIGDIERIASKLVSERINPKEMVSLKKYLFSSVETITELATNNFTEVNLEEIDDIKLVANLIERAILEDPKLVVNEGDIINPSYDETLKKYNEARVEGRTWISELEYQYKQDTGINNLKIRM